MPETDNRSKSTVTHREWSSELVEQVPGGGDVAFIDPRANAISGGHMTAPHEAFKARQQTIELDGLGPLSLRIAYTDAGAGEPVLLLHGIPTWSFLYANVIPLLRAALHRGAIASSYETERSM
jgi:hypothetical protein